MINQQKLGYTDIHQHSVGFLAPILISASDEVFSLYEKTKPQVDIGHTQRHQKHDLTLAELNVSSRLFPTYCLLIASQASSESLCEETQMSNLHAEALEDDGKHIIFQTHICLGSVPAWMLTALFVGPFGTLLVT